MSGTNRPKLRSNFEPGTTRWAVRLAQWKALGLTDEDMEKPKIAVVNTSSKLSICFSHLDGVADAVSQAIRAAGGVPFEIRTVAPSDFIQSANKGARYILPSRDLIANDIEVAVEGALLDGMVMLASCDKTAPGQLMASARLDIPSIFVICGYQGHGEWRGHKVDIEEVFESVGKVVTGGMPVADLKEMADASITSPGVCPGMGTANSMHLVTEALGMCLPGSAPVLGNSPAMFAQAAAAGARIVEMVHEGLSARKVLTPAAFRNAAMMVLASSCSVNCIRHLQAVADEAELPVSMYDLVDELGPRIPLLAAIRPNGETRVEEMEAGGGGRGVLKRLEAVLDLSAVTCTGRTWGEELARYDVPAGSVLRTMDNAISYTPALVVLRGTLAPHGSLLKLGAGEGYKTHFKGPAVIFHSQDEAIRGLGEGKVKPGDVCVLRYLGPRGGPGLAFASWFVAALNGAGLGESCAVVTDGQLSGLNRGIAVNQIAPEAFEGGPLALVAPGDLIEIDVDQRRLDLLVDEATLAARAERLEPWQPARERGWLSIFQRLAKPIYQGATLTPNDGLPAAPARQPERAAE